MLRRDFEGATSVTCRIPGLIGANPTTGFDRSLTYVYRNPRVTAVAALDLEQTRAGHTRASNETKERLCRHDGYLSRSYRRLRS